VDLPRRPAVDRPTGLWSRTMKVCSGRAFGKLLGISPAVLKDGYGIDSASASRSLGRRAPRGDGSGSPGGGSRFCCCST
jgi:hypothetical protein